MKIEKNKANIDTVNQIKPKIYYLTTYNIFYMILDYY